MSVNIMCNMYSEEILKNLIKLLRRSFPVLLLTSFTARALKDHFGTQRKLGHSKGTSRALQGDLGLRLISMEAENSKCYV